MDKSGKEQAKLQLVWPKKIILKLIEMWQENECLYNPNHENYYSKRARLNALKEMANNLKDVYPEIGPYEVKHKITYLRGQYTREISRAKEKIRSDGEEYVPSVFWFKEMEFLKEFVNRKGSSKLFEQSSERVDDSCDSSQRHVFEVFPIQATKRIRVSSSDTPVSNGSMSEEKDVLLPQTSVSQSNSEKQINEKDDAFCNYIKMELNEITNKNIKDELIEKITLAVFDAKKQQRLYINDFDKFC